MAERNPGGRTAKKKPAQTLKEKRAEKREKSIESTEFIRKRKSR
ncbi:hypothetical protein [Rhodococcus kronopolitis]|uniref:Uncharacterized protein n=1 Tax=Rhodococcus kronopolitis TaxID=1460226 RepID=A0ABV9FSF7_9NOCA